MRLPLSVCLGALFALSIDPSLASPTRPRRDVDLSILSGGAVETPSQVPVVLSIDTSVETNDFDSRQQHRKEEIDYSGTSSGVLDVYAQTSDLEVVRGASADGESPDQDNSGEEKDFASSPAPINEGRRRAGMLGIFGAIAFTSVILYGGYKHRARLGDALSSLPQHLRGLNIREVNFKNIRWPTLAMPTIYAPQRTRRRRLRRTKGGFRPHVSRLRAWADAERGLLNDYDYDGDYERGRLHSFSSGSTSSSDSPPENDGEAFDLGADEDFMVGAAQRALVSGSTAPGSASGKPGKGMGRVWGRWKGVGGKSGKKSRRSENASENGTVLFAVAEADDLDTLELETDEALPLAPTPHRFSSGLGAVKGYGSAG